MAKVQLTPSEQAFAASVRDCVKKIRGTSAGDPQIASSFQELTDAANGLHLSLKARGIEPRHRRHMLASRGVAPTDLEFYRHLHPADDLLKFIEDDEANTDPADTTIGTKFQMSVWSARWGHDDVYYLERTKDGWWFEFESHRGSCNLEGQPTLYDSLRHDSIAYPSSLPRAMERVWRQAENGATAAEVQTALDAVGAWISAVEKATPNAGLFEGF